MFGNSDSVFDFDPFEVGNWMTIAMVEEVRELDDKKRRGYNDDDDDSDDDDDEDGYVRY